MPGRRGRREFVQIVGALLVTGLAVATAVPSAADDEGAGVQPIGSLPAVAGEFNFASAKAAEKTALPVTLVVDDANNLGFTAGDENLADRWIVMYDLARLKVIHKLPITGGAAVPKPDLNPASWSIDAENRRIFMPQNVGTNAQASAWSCAQTPTRFFIYEYGESQGNWTAALRTTFLPCSGKEAFFLTTASYDAEHQKLYMSGYPGSEAWRLTAHAYVENQENQAQQMLIRQVDVSVDPPRLDWEVDLRDGGCGRRDRTYQYVERLGDDVLAYCFDAYPKFYSGLGAPGYVVRIPVVRDGASLRPETLTGDAPQVDPTNGRIRNAKIRRIPSVPGNVTPVADPVSGRLGLVTSDGVNGNAVWIFDPKGERFIGVLTGGFADQPVGNTAAGVDKKRGRAYLLTQGGLLVASIRDVSGGGILTSAAANPTGESTSQYPFVNSPRLAVSSKLGRVFVPLRQPFQCPHDDGTCAGYLVLEDRVPDPPPFKTADPDHLTTQVRERPGGTDVNSSGRALASGARFVVTGGVQRSIAQFDPFCGSFFDESQGSTFKLLNDQFGSGYQQLAGSLECPGRLFVAGGHRDFGVAASEVEAASGSGSTSRAAGLAFSGADTATPTDMQRIGGCGEAWLRGIEASFSQRGGSSSDGDGEHWAGYGEGCAHVQEALLAGGAPDLRQGTNGSDGKGSPVRRSECADFSATPVSDRQQPDEPGWAHRPFTSAASCDGAASRATAEATAKGVAVPSTGEDQIIVGDARSVIATGLGPDGRTTLAFASSRGVVIGPLGIGEVRSLAISRAKGRTGTASTVLARQWCRITYLGDDIVDGCIDPTSAEVRQMLDQFNQVVQKIRLGVPDASLTATPGGYQAVVTKHPEVRAADRAVNDDDSHTVPALEAIVYRDGQAGRNRLVVQLAGVHTESRYGIVELPNFGGDPGPAPTPNVEGPTPPAPGPGPTPPAPDPGPPLSTPTAPVGSPEQFFEEIVRTEVITDTGRAAPPPRLQRQPVGAPRILRVPIEILRDGINLLVQHPREFGLLLVLWSLLSMPFYLGARRRSFARALVT